PAGRRTPRLPGRSPRSRERGTPPADERRGPGGAPPAPEVPGREGIPGGGAGPSDPEAPGEAPGRGRAGRRTREGEVRADRGRPGRSGPARPRDDGGPQARG